MPRHISDREIEQRARQIFETENRRLMTWERDKQQSSKMPLAELEREVYRHRARVEVERARSASRAEAAHHPRHYARATGHLVH